MNIDISDQISGHHQRNELLKNSLLSKGVALDETRSIELHFWSFAKQDAAMLAKALYDEGLLVIALAPAPDDDGERWNVEAGFKNSVDHLTSHPVVKKFVELASRFNSLYDGWGTLV